MKFCTFPKDLTTWKPLSRCQFPLSPHMGSHLLFQNQPFSLFFTGKSRGVQRINEKLLTSLKCTTVSILSVKISFPSRYKLICAGLTVRRILKHIDRWISRPRSSVGRSPTECLRQALLSERGTKCRRKENGKGRNFYHVTSLMWSPDSW